MWFDVGKETYTTTRTPEHPNTRLWFDVGKETYTTSIGFTIIYEQLWFDVGKETYTTVTLGTKLDESCGLM